MFQTIKLAKADGGWILPPDGYVYIEPTVKQALNNYRQSKLNALEAGGLLTGYFAEQHLHIVDVTVPLPKDKRTRTRFYRRDPGHIQQVHKNYKSSNGLLNVLGEWHTHPEKQPSPSSIDIKTWYKIQSKRKTLPTVFLIVGIEDWWLGQMLKV